VVAVSNRNIASLIPARLSSNDRRAAAAPGTFRPTSFPLAELLPLPRAGSLRYSLGRIDHSGRVSARVLLGELGWHAGQHLQFAIVENTVVAHPDPTGSFAVPDALVIVLPASIRRRGGYSAGGQVLLVADPGHGVLVVHPLSALDDMVTTYHVSLLGRPRS
jgi:hypothetical protein